MSFNGGNGDKSEGDELLTTTEAARLLGVDPATVRRYIEAGHLRGMRLPSGVYRVPRTAVDRLRRQLEEDG